MNARVAIFHSPDQPLSLCEVEIPPLQSGEILLEVLGCALCKSDLHTYAGRRNEPTPTILGHEIVGKIVAFGPEPPIGFQPNDRVTFSIAVSCGRCFYCTSDLPQKCSALFKYGHSKITPESPLSGGLASHIILKKGTNLFQVPANLSDPLAAMACCSTATIAAVLRAATPIAGKSVLIFGAGVLGQTACAMCTTLGAQNVMITDQAEDRAQASRRFGASISLPSTPDIATAVQETTDGRGADIVLELSGSPLAAQCSISCSRIGGTVIWAGAVLPLGTLILEPEAIVRRSLTIKGVHNYAPADLQTALEFLAGRAKAFPFEELVESEYPLTDINHALNRAEKLPGRRIFVRPY